MTLKTTLGAWARAIVRWRLVQATVFAPGVRRALESRPGFAAFYRKFGYIVHPYDREHGTETGGLIRWKFVPTSATDPTPKRVYAGSTPSQPSIIRAALRALPALDTFAFVDLGCGKGRPLLVAFEFPFREIIGVDLATDLAEIARKNAARIRRLFPSRVPIRIEVHDATTFPFPPGNLVVFLYNPFQGEPVARVRASIEAALAAETRQLFLVYYNPVDANYFDESPALARYFAAKIPYAPAERGYGYDADDTVVIWQGGGHAPPHPGAAAPLKIIDPEWRAELASGA
jgi:SAM-dependent methyltransferase